MYEVQLSSRTVQIKDFSGRKAVRVLRTLDKIAEAAPEIQGIWQQYIKDYEASNTVDLDRAFARAQYHPEPIFREEPVVIDDVIMYDRLGNPLIRRMPILDERTGAPMLGPDPLGHLSEQDWQASGNKLKRPRTPTTQECFVKVFPKMIELAEKQMASLFGLVCMSNDDISRYSREGDDVIRQKIAEAGDELLDEPFDKLIELGVVCGEVISEQYQENILGKLGPRINMMLNLVGIQVTLKSKKQRDEEAATPTTENSSSPTSATSSTDSPQPTDGTKIESSTELVGVGSEA